MPTSYLTVPEFRVLTIMPSADVDDLDVRAPGFLAAHIELASADVEARLRKRYAVPFTAPYPVKVRAWVSRLVTREAYLRRGIDPTDSQWSTINDAAERVLTEILEAANSETGLFDLPLRADTSASGISAPKPLGYSESSPYVWTDRQSSAARDEDANGEGSYG